MSDRQYVGIDLRRRRSVVVRSDDDGNQLSCVRLSNSETSALLAEIAAAGDAPEVVLEATYGWYWLADLLADAGANVHLAHPLGCNWGHRRVKNDGAMPLT